MEINQKHLGGLSLLKGESNLSSTEKEKLDQAVQSCINAAEEGKWQIKIFLTEKEVDFYKQYFRSLGLKVDAYYLERLEEYACELSWRF